MRKFKNQFAKQTYATGGTVRGYSPHDKADNIPAWLTANEYVQPVAAVRHYGTDFIAWISTKELDQIIALTVGELVEFIVSCRS